MTSGKIHISEKSQVAKFSQKKEAIAKKKKIEKRAQIIPPHPHPALPAQNQNKTKIEKRKSVASPQKLRKKYVFGREL